MKKADKLKEKADRLLRDNAPINEIKKARAELIEEVDKERKSLYFPYKFDTLDEKNAFKSKAANVGISMQELMRNLVNIASK